MKLFICLWLLVMSSSVLPYKPTFESLLRNGNNINIGKNTVLANLTISEIDPISNQKRTSEEGIINNSFVKYVIFNENERYPEMTQLEFSANSFRTNMMKRKSVYRFTSFKSLGLNNEQIEAKLYYSLMNMLLVNKSSMFMDLLKSIDPNVRTNKELINQEKLALLRSYKTYLIAIKNDKESNLENPLKPSAEDKKEKAKSVYNDVLLKNDNLVKRQKVGDDFFYLVDSDKIKVKLDADHNLLEMTLETNLGKLSIVLGSFLKMGSGLSFPEYIWITDLSGKKFEIKMEKFSMFPDNQNAHRNRLKKYQKSIETNNITDEAIRPNFLL